MVVEQVGRPPGRRFRLVAFKEGVWPDRCETIDPDCPLRNLVFSLDGILTILDGSSKPALLIAISPTVWDCFTWSIVGPDFK